MGVVYRGRDPRIDRTVAIKTVSLSGLEPSAEQEYRERFVVEAKAAGRLSHSGIVTIFDVGDLEAEMPYLVMEFVEGQTLDKLLLEANNELPLNTALRMAQELAEALDYAHAQGVVHRDMKPANILVTTDGHTKIADFGIAKLNQAQLTVHGQVLGSPAYMAPEQLNEEGVDGRSDLFSVGVILYSMLTGHRPFQGNSATTVCFKLVNHDPVAVTAFKAQFPPEIDRIVARAIAKDPGQRYQSGMELANDIRQLRENCGLLQKADSTAGSPRNGTIPPYVGGISGGRREQNGAGQDVGRPTRSKLKWTGLLPTALLVIAIAFITRSAIDGAHPQPSQAATTEAAIGKSTTTNKTSVSQRLGNETLQIQIQHHFMEARVSLWLDNRLLYTHSVHGDTKTRAHMFRRVEGIHSASIAVPAGKHTLRVRIQSVTDHYDQSKTIGSEFIGNSQKTLEIICDKKHGELKVSLQRRSE
jgi:serine/threonine protein kinase